MNAYQQKWIEILQHANVPGWTISESASDILVKVPDNRDIRELANNMETVLAQMSLDIAEPKERLKFIIKNSREEVDYILNPDEGDLENGKKE